MKIIIVSDVESLFHVLAFEERWGFKFAFVNEFSNNSFSINAVETRCTRREEKKDKQCGIEAIAKRGH